VRNFCPRNRQHTEKVELVNAAAPLPQDGRVLALLLSELHVASHTLLQNFFTYRNFFAEFHAARK
jgi:hypothetical protein